MSRKVFETQDDRKNESDIADLVADKWRVEMQKLPMSQRLDFAMLRKGKVAALCEIKKRSFTWNDYPDVILSASKVKYAKEMYEIYGVKSFFVVSDRQNDIRYASIHDVNYELQFGGRTKTPRDNQDSELIVGISIYDFERL